MSPALGALCIVAGGSLVLLVVADAIRFLVVPRGLVIRWTRSFDKLVRRLFRGIAGRMTAYERRDRLLTYEGPFRLIGYLILWVGSAFAGYGLIYWPFVGSLGQGLAAAGSAMFTLGFVAVPGGAPQAIAFLAAATGLILVALQISYLPVIYQAFNRREALVTMLSSRAGQPPWGPEVLARHALIDSLDELPSFFRDWEMWAADVAETHTNYPVLLAFRSPDPMRSWVVALNAMLDAASLYLALAPERAPSQARNFIRMGYSALREVAVVMQIQFDDDPLPDSPVLLTRREFDAALQLLDEARFPRERDPAESWKHFRGWRVNYESLVYEIADRLNAVPAPWSGPRRRIADVYSPQRPRHRHPGDSESHVHDALTDLQPAPPRTPVG